MMAINATIMITNNSIAHQVAYHTGSTLMISMAGSPLQCPSLLAAFTKKRYVPVGKLEYDTLR